MAQDLRPPHLGITVRREAIQEPRVHTRFQSAEHCADLAEQQRERDVIVAVTDGEKQTMKPALRLRIGAGECRAHRAKRGPSGECVLQFARGEWKAFHRHIVQTRPGGAGAAPQVPRDQEIEAGAEAKLADGELIDAPPPVR